MRGTVLSGKDACRELGGVLKRLGCKKFLLVCGSSFDRLPVKKYFDALAVPYVSFRDFRPNPLYEDVCRGVAQFRAAGCDTVVAVGGGSAMDVAKCIKLYAKMDPAKNYLEQECFDSGIPLIALPTTAGTGSEATRFAVIYYRGSKQSVHHESIVPDVAILAPEVLSGLPLYQKKCAMLDALCQGIESWWSVNSTEESRAFSKIAVETVMAHGEAYLFEHSAAAAERVLLASNYAGRAINITETTAPHAMSYKLTSLYGIPHGHAVALCLPKVWGYMQAHPEHCVDPRGAVHLLAVFEEIAAAMGVGSPADAAALLESMLQEWEMAAPVSANRKEELAILSDSVNPVRLRNNPVALSRDVIFDLYRQIVIEV